MLPDITGAQQQFKDELMAETVSSITAIWPGTVAHRSTPESHGMPYSGLILWKIPSQLWLF